MAIITLSPQVKAQETIGGRVKVAYTTVTVDIINQNDNDPQFTQSSYTANVTENLPDGTFVIKVEFYTSQTHQVVLSYLLRVCSLLDFGRR